jgi:hypothetical protein
MTENSLIEEYAMAKQHWKVRLRPCFKDVNDSIIAIIHSQSDLAGARAGCDHCHW